jgi:hypothetical protein
MKLYGGLQWHGLLADNAQAGQAPEQLAGKLITFWRGFDPTADSLPLGRLVPLLLILLVCGMAPTRGSTPVMVQDFEQAASQPTVWVVNIPNENASVTLSTDQPHEGKQCLKLHYHFVGAGQFQYLGIPNKVRVQGPVSRLHFWLKGDNSKCSYGLQVTDAGGETHQFRSLSSNTG